MTMRRDRFEECSEDFAWCERVIERGSTSFYRAFSQLPHEKRQGVFAIYTFCRFADDCVDREASRALLDDLTVEFERFCAADAPDKPLWRALDVVFETFDMDERPFFDMLEGQRRDLEFRQPQTMEELEDYAYYVAGSVGLMLLPVLHAESASDASLRASAVALGVAMQLTNILRDVGEDWASGRVYLPMSVLEEATCSPEQLAARRADETFVRAWELVARRSEELYLPMQRDVLRLDEDSRMPTLSSLFLYRGILDQVRVEGYPCLERRVIVPKGRAMQLIREATALLGKEGVLDRKPRDEAAVMGRRALEQEERLSVLAQEGR